MLKGLFISIGISILVGIGVGHYTSEKNYYYVHPNKPKREISEAKYNKTSSDRKKIEEEFNIMNGVIGGLASLGACLIIVGIVVRKKKDY